MTLLRYSLLRTLLLFGCMFTLWLAHVRDPVLLLGLTGITSLVLSYFVLKGPRQQLAAHVAERAGRRLAHQPVDGYDEDADAEDREADRASRDDRGA